MAPALPVIRVTGPGRNVGKTWLASRLIEWFASRGYLVAAVKRSHHLMPADLEGSDSHRFAEAGAQRVLFCGGDGTLTREAGAAETLEEIVRGLVGEVDLAIVEGFRDDVLGAAVEVTGPGAIATLRAMDGSSIYAAPADDVDGFATAIERAFGLSTAGSIDLRALVRRSAAAHGHLCAGVVLGVRMVLRARDELRLEDIGQRHRLAVVVETARCMTDAIASATGCTPGSGDLRVVEYGKAAATFLDRKQQRAIRVLVREEARDLTATWAPPSAGAQHRQTLAYRVMPDDALLDVQEVRVDWPEPLARDRFHCPVCGEAARADTAVRAIGSPELCIGCAAVDRYYQTAGATKASVRSAGDASIGGR